MNHSAAHHIPLWMALTLSALSGGLLTAAMPGFDIPLLGWVALVPLLVVLLTAKPNQVYLLGLPFGLIFSLGVHNWYPHIFPPLLGSLLIVAVGTYYAGVLHLGVWLSNHLPAALRLLGLPVAWAAIEYLKYTMPVLEDWWFVLLADSQWRTPPALQILSVTGVFGLSFLIMLVNVSLAMLVIPFIRRQTTIYVPSLVALLAAILIVGWGALSIQPPTDRFSIAVLTDMVNQDPLVLAQGEFAGTRVTSPQVAQAIFATDASLTRAVAAQNPAFVVFPENEFADADDPLLITPLRQLAQESHAYIAADTLWQAPTGLHDTVLLIAPDGSEVARRAKINITAGEAAAGISAGPHVFASTPTPYGNVGIAVCWDVHRLWIIRELARAEAKIILLPMDNDFNGVATFPPFHAADAVFRAVENRVTFGLGTVNGLSLVIDPYGRISAEGRINQRGVTLGETFTLPGRTIYTRIGDWFGWTLVGGVLGLMGLALTRSTPPGGATNPPAHHSPGSVDQYPGGSPPR